ncbi:MAG: hypothetical protein AAB837_01970 [Patescibacteria group bacterium]
MKICTLQVLVLHKSSETLSLLPRATHSLLPCDKRFGQPTLRMLRS